MKSPQKFRVCVGPVLITSLISTSAVAQFVALPPSSAIPAPITLYGDLVDNVVVPRTGTSITVPPTTPPQHVGGFGIVIVPGPGLAANPTALAAFNRAADSWKARITDPITVTINADLAPLGAGILGSTMSTLLVDDYTTIRNLMVADGADEPSNGVTQFLPTAANFRAILPAPNVAPGNHERVFLDGTIVATKANLKALNYPQDLDADFGVSDGTIKFSNTFPFDFDRSNGVDADKYDFQTVAAHEIGHVLGFFSIVDTVNQLNPSDVGLAGPFATLDMYRFLNGGPVVVDPSAPGGMRATDPSTFQEFATAGRDFEPGHPAITDDLTSPYLMSTGLNIWGPGVFPGTDGRQASHWKDDQLVGPNIGTMDPTLNLAQTIDPMNSDFRAMDLIGYDIVPEPTGIVSVIGLAGLLGWRVARRTK